MVMVRPFQKESLPPMFAAAVGGVAVNMCPPQVCHNYQ